MKKDMKVNVEREEPVIFECVLLQLIFIEQLSK